MIHTTCQTQSKMPSKFAQKRLNKCDTILTFLAHLPEELLHINFQMWCFTMFDQSPWKKTRSWSGTEEVQSSWTWGWWSTSTMSSTQWRPGLSTALTLGTWSSILTSSYGNILVVYVRCVWGLGQLLPHCFIYSYL